MLGAIIGDIVGSIYEFNNHRSREFPLFGQAVDFTDDTVCTVAIADSLLGDRDPAQTLREWCRRYPGRGYGGMFARWIEGDGIGAYGSFGNGAAMRVSPCGLLARSLAEAIELADRVTTVTHDHPEGIKGARATAVAIWLARDGLSPSRIRTEISGRFGYDLGRSVDDIRPRYEFNETCQQTVPEALTCALEAMDYEDAIRNAISIGGDSDTVAAIAGGVAEALFGLSANMVRRGLQYLPGEMVDILGTLYSAAGCREIGLRS